jgi:hypothetical protein
MKLVCPTIEHSQLDRPTPTSDNRRDYVSTRTTIMSRYVNGLSSLALLRISGYAGRKRWKSVKMQGFALDVGSSSARTAG